METNTGNFAARELEILVKSSPDPNNRPLIEEFIPEILALVEKFGLSGQSGGSAPYTASAISQAVKKLCLQKPICDIMGIDEEWMDVSRLAADGTQTFQNIRCGTLFKESATAPAYYLDAILWKTQTGGTWSGTALLNGEKIYSRQYVKSFPFRPKTFYIDVVEKEVAKDDWEFYVSDAKQLEKVFKYYDRYFDLKKR